MAGAGKHISPDWKDKDKTVIASVDDVIAFTRENTSLSIDMIPVPPYSYIELKTFLDTLEQKEGPECKNMFGQYTVPYLQKLSSLLTKWEENNVAIGNSCQSLIKMLYFKYPNNKRVVHLLEKDVADISRRLQEHERNLQMCSKMLSDTLSDFLLPRDLLDTDEYSNLDTARTRLVESLQNLGNRVPDMLRDVQNALQAGEVGAALEFYSSRASAPLRHLQGVLDSQGGSDSSEEWTCISASDMDGSEEQKMPSSRSSSNADVALTPIALSTPELREGVVLDLCELDAFLSTADSEDLAQSGPSKDELAGMRSAISLCKKLITCPQLRMLSALSSDATCYNRAADKIVSRLRRQAAVRKLREEGVQQQSMFEESLTKARGRLANSEQFVTTAKDAIQKLIHRNLGVKVDIVFEGLAGGPDSTL
eukprot:CAMPEP_0185034586 /NCGR_PEP_ID=MMETSP1103-20130426/24609_1 /TAXON_ID=36769 /ORGANISM="Paraphysomonas bandaiensis, Strain Caron Lab Isolate" /LENGTH=422 /DNA_ID=CAMNT_0027571307 /DNA_START=112 /DNA_END=1381 /DNA_ORIENTATION=-